MKMYVANAFSLSMLDLPKGRSMEIQVGHCEKKGVAALIREMRREGTAVVSAIGHADTAVLVSKDLGEQLECNRVSLSLGDDDVLVVAQYSGPRLPEGTTVLPEGAGFEYYLVR